MPYHLCNTKQQHLSSVCTLMILQVLAVAKVSSPLWPISCLLNLGLDFSFFIPLQHQTEVFHPFVHFDDPATSGCSKGLLYFVVYFMLSEVGSGLKFLFTFAILNRSVSSLS